MFFFVLIWQSLYIVLTSNSIHMEIKRKEHCFFEMHEVMKSNCDKLIKVHEQLSELKRNVANKSYYKTSHP